MKISNIFKEIIKKSELWNYYNKNIKAPILTNTDDCFRFITEYIKFSKKTDSILFENVKKLKTHSPQRMSHIVSTFFLGLWLFHNKRSHFIHDTIMNELSQLKCFQDNNEEIEIQFTFVWFMATLFHDLGYPAEDAKDGTTIPDYQIPDSEDRKSVPDFYKNIYKDYYKYRTNKEHGIYAGLTFDKDICQIREIQENYDTNLNWKKELEELYHYVAWIILSHNIWMIRNEDKNRETIEKYFNRNLQDLIMSANKRKDGIYEEYKIRFEEYPLFTMFCIVDTIEPIKSSSCLSNIDIQVKSGNIIINSNDNEYCKKVMGLNDWLTPTIENKGNITIMLKNGHMMMRIKNIKYI